MLYSLYCYIPPSLTKYVQDGLFLLRKVLKQVAIFALLGQFLAPGKKGFLNGFWLKIILFFYMHWS